MDKIFGKTIGCFIKMKENKILNKLPSSWDEEAENPAIEHVRGHYLTKLFTTAVNKGIKLIKNKEKLKILKVDLWNEGIDLERNILKHYKNKNFGLYGIDISRKVCKAAEINEPNILASSGSINNLAFKDNVFDLVFDPSTSDHMPFEEISKIIKEYSRCLKNKGSLVLIFDYHGFFWRNYLKYIELKRRDSFVNFNKAGIEKRFLHPIKLVKKEIKKYFDIEGEYCIDYTGWTWNRITKPIWGALPESFYNLLIDLEYSKISKFMKPFAKQYVIIANKKQFGD